MKIYLKILMNFYNFLVLVNLLHHLFKTTHSTLQTVLQLIHTCINQRIDLVRSAQIHMMKQEYNSRSGFLQNYGRTYTTYLCPMGNQFVARVTLCAICAMQQNNVVRIIQTILRRIQPVLITNLTLKNQTNTLSKMSEKGQSI